MITSFIF